MHQQIREMSTKVADVAAAGSISGAAIINLANINTMVQIAAGVVAIIAGVAAAVFHGYKTYDLRQKRKGK